MATRIAFTGLGSVGKTTASDFLVEKYNAVKISWANPVKIEVYNFLRDFRIRNETINGNCFGAELTQMPIPWYLPLPPKPFGRYDKVELEDKFKIQWINANKLWLRKMLQWWGTDYRRKYDTEYWVKQGIKSIDVFNKNANLTVDDSRFENELEELTQRDFTICRIDRPGVESTGHSSDRILPAPYVINNEGSIKDLYDKIERVIDDVQRRLYNG